MRVLLQVVQNASCVIDEKTFSSINKGFLLFVGFTSTDNEEIMKKVINKITSLRVFLDSEGKTNLSLEDVHGEIMCISQFTLYADIKKGRRPSFVEVAKQEISKPLYEKTLSYINELGYTCKSGVFGADMKINLINDGPFTIILDSKDL